MLRLSIFSDPSIVYVNGLKVTVRKIQHLEYPTLDFQLGIRDYKASNAQVRNTQQWNVI